MYTLKKSLGQHFLKDESVSERIMEAIWGLNPKRVLEVGPGGGALTKYLLREKNLDFRAVEIDHEKVVFLETNFPDIEGKILEGSVLDMEPPFADSFTVVGNFPYNISTQILFRILDWRDQVEAMVGMFQKEVAERVAAGPGTKAYGIPSVLIQTFFQVDYLFTVDEDAFTPPPQVKSGVIMLKNMNSHFPSEEYQRLLRLLKAAFGQRRKQLRNPLKPYFDPLVLREDLFSRRAEELSVPEFHELVKRMR